MDANCPNVFALRDGSGGDITGLLEPIAKEDIDRWTKFADSVAKQVPELFDESQASKLGREFDSRHTRIASGYELRALRLLLKEKDSKDRSRQIEQMAKQRRKLALAVPRSLRRRAAQALTHFTSMVSEETSTRAAGFIAIYTSGGNFN